jgi:ribosomal protein S18 acetylase RimI-like enzyme
MADYVIDRAQEADVAAIQAVAGASWRAAYTHIFSDEFIAAFLADWYTPERLLESMHSPNGCFLVARQNGRVVGYAQMWDGQQSARLTRLYVLPDFWRQGIGAALLAAGEAWLRERGHLGYFCTVEARNEVGKAFYRKHGFVHRPQRDERDAQPGMDEWYMWKDLNPPTEENP